MSATAADTTVLSNDFETSFSPWHNRGDATVELTGDGHESSSSVLVSGRTQNWHGIERSVLADFAAGVQYTISGWVKLAPGAATDNLKFTVAETGGAGGDAYVQVNTPAAVTDGAWVKLSGTYTRPADVATAVLYVEAGEVATSYLFDDFLVTGPGDGTDPQPNVALSSDLESTFAPWRGRGAVLALADGGHSGDQSVLVSGRTANWQGIETDVSGILEPGVEYTVSGWVKLAAGEDPANLKFTVAEQSAAEAYIGLNDPVATTSDDWVELRGTYTMPEGLTAAWLYVEASGAQTSFLLDDVLITGGTPDLGLSNDFESGLGPWSARSNGTATAEVTDTVAHGGAGAALVTGRAAEWNGLAASVTGIFQAGVTYHLGGWVRLAGDEPAPATVYFSIERTVGGDTTWSRLGNAANVTSTGWKQIDATFTMNAVDSAQIYFETGAGTADLLIDDIVVEVETAPEVQLDIPSLKDELPWPVGVAIDERETIGSAETLVTKHFAQITAENYMKPESIQPEEGVFTFDKADQLVDFAVEHDLRVYGHTLVWHSQTPSWFFERDGEPLTTSAQDQELLRQRMQTHIQTVADHFRAKYGEYGTEGNPIVAFDVVNEAIAESESDGLRRSEWYRILGPDYLELAFDYASAAFNDGELDGPVKLFINDYNTEFPAKRQAMFDVVDGLLDAGVPVNGVGHQFHLSLGGPVAQMKATIDTFAELGLLQGVSELDVQIDGTVTDDKLVEQGYYFAQIFDMLRAYPDLFSVTIWGPYDSRSWRTGAPLVFDDQLQAKPAYWGIVDPDELPTLTRSAAAHQSSTIGVDPAAAEWSRLPLVPVATSDDGITGFQTRWTADGLVAYVSVVDPTDDGADDTVEIFAGGESVTVHRDDADSASAAVVSTADGYVVVARVALAGLAEGDEVPFDVRITDGGDARLSWNDLSNGQEDGERLGNVSLIEPLGFVQVPHAATAPVVDGEIDALWVNAPVVSTGRQVEGSPGASAEVRSYWSGSKLYALFEVTDPQLDKANSNAWEQDSIEIFVDPGNAKAGSYRPDDGQYRVNFENAVSISGDLSVIGDRLTSATSVTDDGYLVEVAIDLGGDIEVGDFAGIEFQVNDATAGARNSVRNWADPTGRSYQNTTRWGVGEFAAASALAPFTKVVRPVISGTPRVGSPLTVKTGTWVPAAEAYQYVWKVGSTVVGTGASFTPTAAQLNKTLTVTVTGARAGYAPKTAPVSAASKKVVAGVFKTATPTISGTRAVGYPLTAAPGAWSPSGAVFGYQWLRDGKKIAGATSATYTLVGSDAGRRISVTVKGTKPGYTAASKTSAKTGTIAPGAFSATVVPTISGTARVGSVLTASAGVWEPGPVKLSYQWLLNGARVKNATKSTFTLPASAAGGLVEVQVTGSRTGYTKVVRVSAAVAVDRGQFVSTTPVISGTVKAGAKVTALRGAWSPTSGTTFRYQWYWQTAADAPLNPISKATGSSYTIPTSLTGRLLSVKVTAVRPGFTTVSLSSAPTDPVLGKLSTKTPKISGTVKVGRQLTAVAGNWGPAGVVLSYQWVRVSGKTATPILDATGAGYLLTSADKGKTIRVQVTGTLAGYAPSTVSSAVTKKVG